MRTERVRYRSFAAVCSLMSLVGAAPLAAQGTDSVQVARVVHAYHEAEKAGDSTAMVALLSDDAVILESGGSESKADFRAHHVAADINFTRTARIQRSDLRVRVRGDAAWVTSTSTVERQVNGSPVTSTGAELMVLARDNGSWKITAIHWSSRQRRSPS
jgi:ketosteroid isomerase-like protein